MERIGRGLRSPTAARAAALAMALCALPAAAQTQASNTGSWDGLAGSATRASVAAAPLPPITTPTWTRSTDADGNLISFIGQACIAVSESNVYAAGRVSPPGGPANQPRLFAFSRDTGAVNWWMPLSSPVLDSDSGPALERAHGTVIFAAARFVTAFDQVTGAVRWQTQLARSVVNASALMVEEPGEPGRAFITTYDGFGASGALYCINVANPGEPGNPDTPPGQILWSVPIGGSSGNTPAYLPRSAGGLGLVYVTTVADGEDDSGSVLAFPADAAGAPAPAMVFTNVVEEGFFGGVCVLAPEAAGQNPALLCASYAFYGGLNSANLVKIDGVTGELIWSVPCNRSGSIPVPLPGGRIAISTGIQGYGSVPSLELFQDQGTSATLLWDSAINSWFDSNGNGAMDPGEYLAVGGWTQQPIISTFGGRSIAALGLIPSSGTFSAPSNDLWLLDLSRDPSDPLFQSQHATGAGGGTAVAGAAMYSIGTAGLVAYGPTPSALDVNSDGRIGVDDLYAWESGQGSRDVNADGQVNADDRTLLINALRCGNAASMKGERP
jgi:hypothetical protein